MLVSSFNLLQSFNYTPYIFYKKLFKPEINSSCIWTLYFSYCSTCYLLYGMMKEQAESEGYRPDSYVTSDEVARARPGPAMIFLNMVRLDVFPVQVQRTYIFFYIFHSTSGETEVRTSQLTDFLQARKSQIF
jgi:hypothetical protein